MSEDIYGGYEPSSSDILLDGCRLICTCTACPEQYDVFDDSTGIKLGYLRLRHGWFRADYPDCGGDTVYESRTKGNGSFDEDERITELTAAVKAIKERARL